MTAWLTRLIAWLSHFGVSINIREISEKDIWGLLGLSGLVIAVLIVSVLTNFIIRRIVS